MQPSTRDDPLSPRHAAAECPALNGGPRHGTALRVDIEADRMRAEAAPHRARGDALPADFDAAA